MLLQAESVPAERAGGVLPDSEISANLSPVFFLDNSALASVRPQMPH